MSLPWWKISITAVCLSSVEVARSELAFRKASMDERFERLEGRKPKRDGIMVNWISIDPLVLLVGQCGDKGES